MFWDKQLGYSSINGARSAISFINVKGQDSETQHLVSRFMKGIHNIRPSIPRYHVTWDPDIVFTLLKTWHPVSEMDLKTLTWKVAMLLLLLSGRRGNTIVKLLHSNIQFLETEVKIAISEPTKTTKIGKHEPEIIIKSFKDKRLCLPTILKHYCEVTSKLSDVPQLFRSYAPPYGNITTSTLSRWVRKVMELAGVDTTRFKPHSTRSAATSKAAEKQVSLATIQRAIGWRSESTMARFYNKPISNNCGELSKGLEPCLEPTN